jgi:hypothetical protein
MATASDAAGAPLAPSRQEMKVTRLAFLLLSASVLLGCGSHKKALEKAGDVADKVHAETEETW